MCADTGGIQLGVFDPSKLEQKFADFVGRLFWGGDYCIRYIKSHSI